MSHTISEVQLLLQAEWLQQVHPDATVASLMLDTRHLPLPGSLFFAIPGQRLDGHFFINEAWSAGVRNFVVSRRVDISAFPDTNFLLVPDTLGALQQLVAAHRAQFAIPVIGITGSNGKTIVKEWLYQLLANQFQVVRSPKSYNSQIGVPLSVWEMRSAHTLGIFEAGISQPGEMARLQPVIQPSLGIFTNIGPAHREGFLSDEQKIREKMQLFEYTDQLVCCADQDMLLPVLTEWENKNPSRKLWSWSKTGRKAAVQLTDIQALTNGGTTMSFHWEDQPAGRVVVTIPFSDSASIENAAHCFVTGLALGVDSAVLATGLSRLEPLEMRLELKSGVEGSTLINDFYNNDLASLRILLQFGTQQAKGRRITLILSDILQSGTAPATLYREVASTISGVHRLIGIGTEVPALEALLPAGVERSFYPDTATFMAEVGHFVWRDNLILLKGARPFEFEKIARRLEQKAHQTRLEIHLNALIHNLNVYKGLLQPGVKMMAMVKAAAYGSGGAEVARLLEFHKIDYLGVAYADEGIELRQAGVHLPIMVLNPETTGFDIFYRYQLEPEVYSLAVLETLIGYTGVEKKMTIHIKLDTGMHRLGFEKADISELGRLLREHPNLKVASVFSHLSASDNPAHDDFTHRQASAFTEMYTAVAEALGYHPLRHIANTSGISRFPEYHFDMVRLGIGLYGIDGGGLQNRLQVVNVLKATVSQVKNIPAGDTVGYNRNSGLLNEPRRTATISIGYADGFLRVAGGGRYKVLVNNQLAPTIGNICMDMTMIDVTHIPGVKAGDEVVVFGENPLVQCLAETQQTIPYEIFTNISERVKRVYVQE